MISPAESLLKYDDPVLLSRGTDRKSPKARPLRVSNEQPPVTSCVPPPPKPRSDHTTTQQHQEIIDAILPPREWMEANQLWVQQVSSTPSTRDDVVTLRELLELKMQQRHGRETGICPVRRELYSQCFDELIRHVTINCDERGLLLSKMRDEIQITIAVYQTLHESSSAFGMKKAVHAKHGKTDLETTISDLENENQDLEKQVNEQKAECEALKKRETERRQVEEQNHTQEIQCLTRTIQQMKAQLEGIITPKK
ncbi:axonemal dynein light intermediate polypeptide 1 [Myripristis murdjan]|uniref:axonemal dynein light intermediate polypeptide 1 n=1 Tax=Myripristis murdjan TaxID=586833 RepID=UPI0011760354|nr:axonemal dynein light intermediate polypeptide 1 [Myripristis murdjan]